MFLTESYNYNYNTSGINISADPICGMQICLEAERAWHKMEMQMIKLEHTAIVNNNMELLREGEDGWWEKTKSWFKKTKETFLRYLDRVIDKWQEIQMRIKSRWMDVSKMMDRIKENAKSSNFSASDSFTVQVNIAMINFAKNIVKNGSSLDSEIKKLGDKDGHYYEGKNTHGSDNTDAEIFKLIEKASGTDPSSYSGDGTTMSNATGGYAGKYSVAKGLGSRDGNSNKIDLTTTDGQTKAEGILKFLKDDRQKAIDILKKCRNEGAKLLEKGISEGNARDEAEVEANKRAVTKFKNVMNGYIIAINKASVQALKIFSIAATKNIKADKFKKKMDNIDSKIGESFTPYNILDQFN